MKCGRFSRGSFLPCIEKGFFFWHLKQVFSSCWILYTSFVPSFTAIKTQPFYSFCISDDLCFVIPMLCKSSVSLFVMWVTSVVTNSMVWAILKISSGDMSSNNIPVFSHHITPTQISRNGHFKKVPNSHTEIKRLRWTKH